MEISIRQSGNVKIFELSGIFDEPAASAIRQALLEATASQPARVVFNLRGVQFMDSRGISALAAGYTRVHEKQGFFCLCNLQPSLRLIFELIRFDKVIEIYSSEEVALREARKQ
jgi:anti-sigma B factor antagonist